MPSGNPTVKIAIHIQGLSADGAVLGEETVEKVVEIDPAKTADYDSLNIGNFLVALRRVGVLPR